ncbi:MAG: methionyl-tRNA formyltransferase [Acidobacteriota bacterium]|nr:methionyl-tRNA formyltransferase [Acidobacteriota bacterium]MDE3264520.1 methionyl-tRNA formyltransferase [Acidobacteriota bacterium]
MSARPRFERIAFFGTPEFAVPSLAALDSHGRRPIVVVSQPARRAGRGGRVVEPPVARWAQAHGVNLLQPTRVRDDEFLGRLRALELDLAVVAAYGKIFPRSLLELPSWGCLNVHASLLPAWRGASPIQAAIASGESVTGVTTMVMEEGLDTGPILLREEVAIGPLETAGELAPRLAEVGARLLVRTLDGLEAGEVVPRPQRDAVASYAPMLRPEDGVVDWDREAGEIACRVRAYEPWPGSRTWLRSEAIRIVAARSLTSFAGPDRGNGRDRPGAFLGSCQVGGIGRVAVVRCGGSSALALDRVQRPGRRPVSGVDLANGLRLKLGERFGVRA